MARKKNKNKPINESLPKEIETIGTALKIPEENTTKDERPEQPEQEKPQLQRHFIGKETVLYKAGIDAGFTAEQVAGFDSAEALKEAIRRIKPGLIAAMEAPMAEAAKKPLPSAPPSKLENKFFTFYSKIDSRMTQSANHASMEEQQIQSNIRAKFIKQQDIQEIRIVRSMRPDKAGVLVSQVTVNYMG